MNAKRNVTQGLLAAAVVVGAIVAGAWGADLPLGAKASAKVTPYTVILREIVVDPQGVRRPGSLYTHAVRSDGSIAQKLGPAGRGSRIVHFANGERVQTNDTTERKSTLLVPDALATWHRDPASGCLNSLAGGPATGRGEVLVGEESVAGYRAARVTAGTTTWWFALDHGCAQIGSRMDFGEKGASIRELVSLSAAEPGAELFLIPASYPEGPPSSLAPPLSAKCDARCQATEKAHFERQDAHYNKHRLQ